MKLTKESYFILQSKAMSTLWKELSDILDEEIVKAVMFRYGFRSGELMAEHVNAQSTDFFQVMREVLTQSGMGRLVKKRGRVGNRITLEINSSPELMKYEDGWSCHFTRGYLVGFFTTSLEIMRKI